MRCEKATETVLIQPVIFLSCPFNGLAEIKGKFEKLEF